MRKGLWSVAALIALLSGTGAILGGGAVNAADTTVNMVDGSGDPTKTWKFEPAEITVAAGSKVVWKNIGDQPHTATADDGSFDSGYLSNGKEFSQVITKSITYKCEPHPWMTGKINVAGGAAPAAPAQQAPPTTAAPAPGSTPTTRTTAAAGATTTTTAKGAGGSTTTTTAGAAGVTSTTQAASVTPTSAPESAGVTTTTASIAGGGEEAAADTHASGGEQSRSANDDSKSSPLGIAFVAVSTVLLVGISGKLLASKS